MYNQNMNKEELVSELSKKAKVTQVLAFRILQLTMETIEKQVSKGKKVTIMGFGTFKRQKRAERTARIINTNKEIRIPECYAPMFIPSKMFKEMVSEKLDKEQKSYNPFADYPHNEW